MSVHLPVVTRHAMSWSFVLVSLLLSGQRATAQRVAIPDSAQMSAAMAVSARMRSPARFALSAQKEIGLSPQQVAALEVLARAESDSELARGQRMMQLLQTSTRGNSPMAGMEAIATWTGPVDEAAIRAAACEQSKAQAEILIGMIRDRHAVGALLTTAQQEALDRLQRDLMSGAFKNVPPNE